MVDGDQSRLQQIAWNLLSNAVKFTPKGGTVIVSVERAGSRVALRVQDTGEGIAPDFLDHVFEPFRQGPSTSVRTGLGLGLAIVRQLVELHGGSITAESAGKGQGSVFIVTFPLRVGDGASAVPRGRSGAPGLEGVRVLVAEDDEDSGAALEAVLRRRGCIVRLARTAAACLTMLAESPADVLLFDVGLPDDDGYSLLRRARRLTAAKPIPAIALTALAGENDRVRALAAGFRAHVPKPFDPDTIVREIIRATERDAS
jgi:CheY-like chemotaxis protein/anti-sigma regulatory factor (Ser/Thr protein kinase)